MADDQLHWARWLRMITGETTVRAIARRVGVSHSTVHRWMSKGIEPEKAAELAVRFYADPIEAAVLTGWLREDDVANLNYEALVRYVPVEFLAAELHRRAHGYSQTRPDTMRKTRTGAGGPAPSDITSRQSFRLTSKD